MINYPQRKSPRLAEYDYAQNGLYFVTICVQNRLHLFGSVSDSVMVCNEASKMLGSWWAELSKKYSSVEAADFVVMPNHFHGLVIIESLTADQGQSVALSEVIGWFKTMTTNAYIRGVKESGWLPFSGRLWQRSYHDHIIRNEHALLNIQQYIHENPARWMEDTFYGDAPG